VTAVPPGVTVVIPTLSRYDSLRRVLDRFERQTPDPAGFAVHVVTDAAEPDRASVERAVGTRPYDVRLLTADRPGASAARNTGWRAAATPLVLFVDDDVLPGPRLVAEHLDWHERHPEPEVGVLGLVRWARELRVTPFMRWLDTGIQFDYDRIQGTDAGWGRFYTANASVKRELIERAGGFEEDALPFGYEDLDLALRMDRLGLRLLYNRRASAEHLHAMDLGFWKRRVARIAVSEHQFVQMHPEVEPYFFAMFSAAAKRPPVRGRAIAAARFVPRWVPGAGDYIWSRVDQAFRQALAEPFLCAWQAVDAGRPVPGLENAR
jgi:GT2 family glycosyltransferase